MNVFSFRTAAGLAALVATVFVAASAQACTGIRLRAQDGSVVCARTMEFAENLQSNLILIPHHYEFVGTTASGQPGLTWKAKYAAAGMNGEGQEILVDGLNEEGLGAGIFSF